MKKFICGICGEELTVRKLKKHIEETHNLVFEDYLREYHPELGGYCSICGKPTKWVSSYFNKTCSIECRNKAKAEGMKKTLLEKYGVENVSQLESIKEKKKQTCLEHYGVDNPAKSKEIKERAKQTCLEKYGVENAAQCEEIKDIIKNNISKTVKAKYGVDWFTQSPDFKNKMYETQKEKWFNQNKNYCKSLNIDILETCEEFYSHYKSKHKFHCNIHDLDFEAEFYNDRNICPECRNTPYSKGEREVGDYIESLGIPIIRNDRVMIKPKEIDIWIPSKNIGIEYNGEYWHQDQSRDQEKKFLCESKGIKLYTIWDTQWDKNKEEVKEYLRRLLND